MIHVAVVLSWDLPRNELECRGARLVNVPVLSNLDTLVVHPGDRVAIAVTEMQSIVLGRIITFEGKEVPL